MLTLSERSSGDLSPSLRYNRHSFLLQGASLDKKWVEEEVGRQVLWGVRDQEPRAEATPTTAQGDADTQAPGSEAATPPPSSLTCDPSATPVRARRAWVPWHILLCRVFHIDISICPSCGGAARLIATIIKRETIERVLGAWKDPASPARGSP